MRRWLYSTFIATDEFLWSFYSFFSFFSWPGHYFFYAASSHDYLYSSFLLFFYFCSFQWRYLLRLVQCCSRCPSLTGQSILRLCALLSSHFSTEREGGGDEGEGEGGGDREKSKLSNRSIRLVTAQCILRICKSHSDVDKGAMVSPLLSSPLPFIYYSFSFWYPSLFFSLFLILLLLWKEREINRNFLRPSLIFPYFSCATLSSYTVSQASYSNSNSGYHIVLQLYSTPFYFISILSEGVIIYYSNIWINSINFSLFWFFHLCYHFRQSTVLILYGDICKPVYDYSTKIPS